MGHSSWVLILGACPVLQGPRLKLLLSNFVAIRYKPAEAWVMGQETWLFILGPCGMTSLERRKSASYLGPLGIG